MGFPDQQKSWSVPLITIALDIIIPFLSVCYVDGRTEGHDNFWSCYLHLKHMDVVEQFQIFNCIVKTSIVLQIYCIYT